MLMPMKMIPGADDDDQAGLDPAGATALDLAFSEGAASCWSADALIARDTDLTRPLADPAYFRRAFASKVSGT